MCVGPFVQGRRHPQGVGPTLSQHRAGSRSKSKNKIKN